MPGNTGFDFNGASKSFNVLAEYLFGKVDRIILALVSVPFYVQAFLLVCLSFLFYCFQNTTKETMEMTTPVITRKTQSAGEKMEMTTPVITTKKVNVF